MMLKNSSLYVFKKNQYPEGLISRVVDSYLDNVHCSNNSKSATDTSTIYFKLPFLKLSNFTQRKVCMLAKKYCKYLNIKLAFSSFKIKNLLAVKDRVNESLHSCVVYKFTCGEPTATPSIWSNTFPLKRKWVCEVAIESNLVSSVHGLSTCTCVG